MPIPAADPLGDARRGLPPAVVGDRVRSPGAGRGRDARRCGRRTDCESAATPSGRRRGRRRPRPSTRRRCPPTATPTRSRFEGGVARAGGGDPRRRDAPGGARAPVAVETRRSAVEIYRSLRRSTPRRTCTTSTSRRRPGGGIVGASPELLVRVRDGQVVTRPIAGTRPRHLRTPSRMRPSRRSCGPTRRSSPSRHARRSRCNDVGRVAAPASVEVTTLRDIERYTYVMHLVSEVRGALAEGLDAFDAVRAIPRPAGRGGAPKVRHAEPSLSSKWSGAGRTWGGRLFLADRRRARYHHPVGPHPRWGRDRSRRSRDRGRLGAGARGRRGGRQGRLHARGHRGAGARGLPPRQLRLVHLQPRPAPGPHRRRCHRRAQRRGHRGGGRDAAAGRHRDLAGPLAAGERGHQRRARAPAGPSFPMLGVCLGTRPSASPTARTSSASPPVHGKARPVHHAGAGAFAGLPLAVRGGALSLARRLGTRLPPELEITAWSEDGVVMGIRYRTHPIEGVQFHPESILTDAGEALAQLPATLDTCGPAQVTDKQQPPRRCRRLALRREQHRPGRAPIGPQLAVSHPGATTDGLGSYIRPTTWPSGSANRAIVVSGATSVSGMITLPPSSSTRRRRAAAGSSVWT